MDNLRSQLSAPSNAPDEDEAISIFVKIPDLRIQKNLQQDLTDTIWSFKQHILDTIATKLTDGLNYGIYCPPANGKAGKFLEEERCWKEYPPNDRKEVEVMYKRRIYKNTTFNAKKVQEVNDKSGQKKFLVYVKTGNLDKVSKLLNRGLDPNFHDRESGETPFTLAVTSKQNSEMLTTLVSGGAHLDFRTKTGHTPLHRAAQAGNKLAIQTLLSFGASPNYKDCKGLTPLYHCVCNKDSPPDCSRLLLREYALHGVTDDTGWTEIHQVCRSGLIGHLRNLIFYGANMNIRNSSGNTPLHICAILKQDECARLLLLRGADKTLTNFANQDPVAAAIVAGNQSTANLIRDFKPEDAAPSSQETPLYNPKRRTVVWQTQQSNLLRQRRFSHSTPHLSQADNQVLTRPGLPWTEKQRHIPGVEVIEEVDVLYDSDSFSGSFSDVSDEEARDEISDDTAWIKKRWENDHLNIPAHGSLDRFHVTNRDEYQSFLSSSPNANAYRRKPEEDEGKTASIRSYPKRLIPSISHPAGVQDQVQVVELRPVASPTSPPFSPKILKAMQSLPTGSALRPKTLSTFAPVELCGSSPNLLSNKAVRPNLDKPSSLLSPPVGVLQRQRQFGSTNDLLRPKHEVSELGHKNRPDVDDVRRSALIDPRNNRDDLWKGPDDLEERVHGQFKKTEAVANAAMLHQDQVTLDRRESLRSYGSAYDLGTGSLPLSGGKDFGQSKSIARGGGGGGGGGRQFGSSDDLLNSDRSGATEEGISGRVEMRTGRKNPAPPTPIRRSHVPEREQDKNTAQTSGELLRKPRDQQRNTYHVGQALDHSAMAAVPLSPPPVSRAIDSDVVDDDKRGSSAALRHSASTASAADYRSSLIAAVLMRRQFAEMGNGSCRTQIHENPFQQTTETDINSETSGGRAAATTRGGQPNSRSAQKTEAAQTMDFLQQAQLMLSTLQKRGQTKTPQQNCSEIQPPSTVPSTALGNSSTGNTSPPAPPPPPPPLPHPLS